MTMMIKSDYLFWVPFKRNTHFLGREDDLQRVHIALQRQGPVGICPGERVSTVGIGKTQLALEYIYRYRTRYRDGIFWLNAARPLAQGFGELGYRLRDILQQEDEMPIERHGRQQLMNTISRYFDEEALKDLCFQLSINYHALSDRGKAIKIRELITTVEQQKRIHELVEQIRGTMPEAFTDTAEMMTTDEPGLDQLIEIAFDYLNQHPTSLLILDNLVSVATLKQPLGDSLIPARLPCRVLFTTRQRNLSTFHPVVLDVLPKHEALKLLLATAKQTVLSRTHPEHVTAQQITAVLGHLPLAVRVAGTYLGKRPDTSLAEYEQLLYSWGAALLIEEMRLMHRHQAGMMATLTGQWELLTNNLARLLLRIAGQLPEALHIPIARLALLAGIRTIPEDTPPLQHAIRMLQTLSFLDESSASRIQVQPLVQAFAQNQTLASEIIPFRLHCVRNLLESLEDLATLKIHVAARGVEAVQSDLLAALDLLPSAVEDSTNLRERLQVLIRLLQRENDHLNEKQIRETEVYFAQRIHYRCVDMGLVSSIAKSLNYLKQHKSPSFATLWVAKRESLRLEHTLATHQGGVLDVAITPDGLYAVSASEDSTLKLWNLATGREERTLTGHEAWVWAVTITPDGRRALSASEDETIRVWNLITGHQEHTLLGHEDVVNAVTVTPDGRYAASASWDNTLIVWDLNEGKEVYTLTGHSDLVQAITTDPDGDFLISASRDGTFKIWRFENGEEVQTLSQPDDLVQAIAVTPDRRRAISTSTEGMIRVWSLLDGQVERALQTEERLMNAIAVSGGGERAVSATSFGTLKVWNMGTGQLEHTLHGHTDSVRSVAITPDGRQAVSASKDSTLKVWDLSYQRPVGLPSGHDAAVHAVAVTPDGKRAISASDDGTLKVWHLRFEQEELTLSGHSWPVNAVAVTPDNEQVVSVSMGGNLKVWDLLMAEVVHTLEGYRAVTITPDGRYAIAGSFDYTLKVWDLATGELAFILPTTNKDAVEALTITPDSSILISAHQSGQIHLWNLDQKQIIHTLSEHTWAINSVVVTQDGRFLISGSDDGTLKVWDIASILANRQVVVQSLHGHTGRIMSVGVDMGGQRIVSASRDHTIRVWNRETSQEITSLMLDDVPTCVAMTTTDGTIIAGDSQGNLYFLNCLEP